MTTYINLLDNALKYHDALPRRIREYLNSQGMTDNIINAHLLGWNGWRISIPIYDRQGSIVFFKLAKDPQDTRPSPAMLTSQGATVELYGWDRLLEPTHRIIVCEGEFDRLVLEAQGFPAIASTAGVTCFRPEWANELKAVEEVYVCFHRNQSGDRGAEVVSVMLPHAKFVELPEEVGEGGSITDFFGRLGKTPDEFERLLKEATATPYASLASQAKPESAKIVSSDLTSRIERIKGDLPIEEFVRRYVELRASAVGATLLGQCPFHNDLFESLAVFPRRGLYYCFRCRAAGDVIAFLAAKEHISFNEAVERLEQIITTNGEPTRANNQQDKAA